MSELVMDDTQGSSFGRPNPFLIPLVLQKIFKDLSLQELSNCRLVCQLWKTYALPGVRKKRLIKILSAHKMKSYIQLMSGVDPDEFPDCNYQIGYIKEVEPGSQLRVEGVRDVRNLAQNTIRRREIEIEEMRAYVDVVGREMDFPPDRHSAGVPITENELLSQFFTLFGDQVKSLELLKHCRYDSTVFPKILSLTPNLESFVFVTPSSYSDYSLTSSEKPTTDLQLPNLSLKSLGIVIAKPSDLEDDNKTKRFLHAMLGMVPNVESLSLGPSSSNFYGRLGLELEVLAMGDILFGGGLLGLGEVENRYSVVKSIILAPSAAPLVHLKHIHLNFRLNDSEVKELTMKGFLLENVKFRFDMTVKGASVDGLLKSLRGTLVKARLEICASLPFSELPTYMFKTRCEKLEDLTLLGYKGSFWFLDNFPGLKSLEYFGPRLEDHVFPLDLIHHSLQELKLRCAPVKTCGVIGRIASSFPNLRAFEFLQGNDECMRAIYLGMPHLENLAIAKAGCSDDGLCGVPKHIYKDIINNKSLALSYVEPGRVRTDLSIASLPNLKSLRLEGDKITDVSVILGIASCKNLEDLSLKSNQITDESLFNIATSRNMKTLKTLVVSRCPLITDVGKTFLSAELPKIGKYWRDTGEFLDIDTKCEAKSFKLQSSGDGEGVAQIHDSDFSDSDEED